MLRLWSYGQTPIHHDPDSVKFITADIDNYWKMYHHLATAKTASDTISIVENEYLAKASPILKDRMEQKYGITPKGFFWGFRSFPKYIASIEKSTKNIDVAFPGVLTDFKKLKALYPPAVFPDYYFVMGDFNSGGKPMPHGMYIGAEIVDADKNSPLDEFTKYPALRWGITTADQITVYCCHELIHWQQKNNEASLLASTIDEGAADFLAELITGKAITEFQHRYGDAHEKELWLMFKKDIETDNYRHWLYNSDVKDIPKDMGYYIGYKICEAYYKKVTDKKQAIKDIIEVTDARSFLKKSGYGQNFEH